MSGLSFFVWFFKEAKVETKCNYLLMFCPFLIPSYKEIVFLCHRELWTVEVMACPLTSRIRAVPHSDAFITGMISLGVSLSSLNHFWFSPLGTKLQAFICVCCFIHEMRFHLDKFLITVYSYLSRGYVVYNILTWKVCWYC